MSIFNTAATWDDDYPVWCIEVCPGFSVPLPSVSENASRIEEKVKHDPQIKKVNVRVMASKQRDGSYSFTVIEVSI